MMIRGEHAPLGLVLGSVKGVVVLVRMLLEGNKLTHVKLSIMMGHYL